MKTAETLTRILNERHIFELLKNNDPSAMNHICNRYRRPLFWIGKQIIRDDFTVETLVQDAFLKLWLNRESIETPRHIFFFLRMVIRRDCFTWHTTPKNKFSRMIRSLESYENFQDYLAGYEPSKDSEHLKDQQKQQKAISRIRQILPLLDPKRKRLIELFLKYGFHYKEIAAAMGTGITEISNELKNTVEDIKCMLSTPRPNKIQTVIKETGSPPKTLSRQQSEIVKLRYEDRFSFADIAQRLKLSEKEVHQEFLSAYKLSQQLNPTPNSI